MIWMETGLLPSPVVNLCPTQPGGHRGGDGLLPVVRWPHLSEELLQQGRGPAVVQVPVLGRVADVRRVEQQR